jgi:tetratricopeptide (TPR) repeat protein
MNVLNENNVMASLHSDPLQYFVELGFPGGLLALAIFYLAIRKSWPSHSASDENNHNLLKLGLLLSLSAGAIHACIDFPLRLPTSAALYWFYLGAAFGLVSTQRNSLSPEYRLLRPVLISIGLIYLLFTLGFYYQYFHGSRELLSASISLKKKQCDLAKASIDRSLQAFDLNYVTQHRYTQVYAYCDFPAQVKLNAMNKVLAYDSTNLLARLTRGVLNIRLNNPDIAESDLLFVAEKLPHRPLAYQALGDVALLKDDIEAAKYLYAAALKRDPDNINVQAMLTSLEGSESDRKPAQNR